MSPKEPATKEQWNGFALEHHDGSTEAHQAAIEGNLGALGDIFKRSPELLTKLNDRFESPLRLAVKNNRADAVMLFVQKGIVDKMPEKIDDGKWSREEHNFPPLTGNAYHYAVEYAQEGILQSLVDSKAAGIEAKSSGYSPLCLAVEMEAYESALILSRGGCNLFDPDPLHSPIHRAILRRDKRMVKLLVERDEKILFAIDKRGFIPMMHAMEQMNGSTVKRGVDFHKKCESSSLDAVCDFCQFIRPKEGAVVSFLHETHLKSPMSCKKCSYKKVAYVFPKCQHAFCSNCYFSQYPAGHIMLNKCLECHELNHYILKFPEAQ